MEFEVAHIDDLTSAARRILEVATELFYRRGIHAVGVDTIAAESGVTKRTLYNNFGSKDALVATYLSNRHSGWWQLLEDRIAVAEPPRALAFFDVYADDARTATRGCAFLNAAAELPRDHEAYPIIAATSGPSRRGSASSSPTTVPRWTTRHVWSDTCSCCSRGPSPTRASTGAVCWPRLARSPVACSGR